MQLRLTNLLLTILVCVALFTTSCKKEFSKDEPFAPVYTPTVFIGSQNQFVYAFEPESGEKKWEYFVGSNIQSSPLVMGDYLYVAAENGFVHKLNAKEGTLVKKITIGGILLSTPYGERAGKDGSDYIYIGTGNTNSVVAYDVKGDSVEWTFPTGAEVYSSPTLFDTLVVFGSYDGKVYAVDKEDGQMVWEFDPGTGGKFYSSPTIAGSRVYIGSFDNKMYALKINDGSQLWSYPTQGIIQSSPISYGGFTIFGSNDGTLYCVDSFGVETWKVKTNDRIVSSPYAYQQVIYVGSYDYSIYAINIIDGTIRWQFPTKALNKSTPMVYNNRLYVGSHEKQLFCLDPDKGDEIWKQNINGLIESSPVVDHLDGRSTNTSSISGQSPH